MCSNCTEGNKNRHKSIKNKAKKPASKTIREKTEEVHTKLENCSNGMPRLVEVLKFNSKKRI